MRLLIKELEPTSGTIRVAGHDLDEITRKRVPYFRRNIGVVFQDFKLLPNRTVYDNVAYALQVTGGSRKEIRAKVPDILRLTGLSTKLHNLPRSALGRRAAARLDRPRVRQSSAAAARRRADRATSTPRRASTSCACSTGSTAPARPCSWPPTTRRWSTRCAAACSSSPGAGSSATRPPACTRATRPPAISPSGCGRPSDAAPRAVAMRLGFFLREAVRAVRRSAAPSFAAAGHRAGHDARARGVHPDRAGDQRRRRQRPQPGRGRRLHEDRRDRRRGGARAAGAARRRPRAARCSSSPSRAAYAQQSKADPPAYQLLGSNPLPDTFHVIPDNPANVLAVRTALIPPGADGEPATLDPVDPERLQQARTTPRRSSRSPTW